MLIGLFKQKLAGCTKWRRGRGRACAVDIARGGAGGAEPPRGGGPAHARGGARSAPWWAAREARRPPAATSHFLFFLQKAEGSYKMADSTKWRP